MAQILNNWPQLLMIFAIIYSAWMFYNTVITRKFRNAVPNEASSWRFGVLYYNPHDPRLLLPKRSGLGLTLNFAKPLSIAICAALLSLVVGSLLL